MGFAVQHNPDLGAIRRQAGFHRGGPRRRVAGEALAVDAFGFHTGFAQRSFGVIDHAFGAAHKHLFHAGHRQECVDQGLDFGAVDAAFEQGHFLGLA